jgi:hypothetical protein
MLGEAGGGVTCCWGPQCWGPRGLCSRHAGGTEASPAASATQRSKTQMMRGEAGAACWNQPAERDEAGAAWAPCPRSPQQYALRTLHHTGTALLHTTVLKLYTTGFILDAGASPNARTAAAQAQSDGAPPQLICRREKSGGV